MKESSLKSRRSSGEEEEVKKPIDPQQKDSDFVYKIKQFNPQDQSAEDQKFLDLKKLLA